MPLRRLAGLAASGWRGGPSVRARWQNRLASLGCGGDPSEHRSSEADTARQIVCYAVGRSLSDVVGQSVRTEVLHDILDLLRTVAVAHQHRILSLDDHDVVHADHDDQSIMRLHQAAA